MECAIMCHNTVACQSFNLGTATPYQCQLLTLSPDDTVVTGSSSFNQYIKTTAMIVPVKTSSPGHWGTWHPWFYCSPGSYMHAVRIKFDDYYSSPDAVGVTHLEVFCKYPDGTSANNAVNGVTDFTPTGSWLTYQECPSGTWIKAWEQSVTPALGSSTDDDALNNLVFHCSSDLNGRSGRGTSLPGTGGTRYPLSLGECPFSSVACGVSLRVEKYQGPNGDDSAVNDVHLACCFIDLFQ
ncbi:vitelline membrane outer layer protein 1 homolog [Penaeus monodon]|uniref:vitelline membrane outer layer protein 1 homolog n=1 Tax=Penaeus monodon TaxID=6687 RepID=UPI0018A76D98|nr:vitelline membrane outer layer protein 1 homolog [Penaeus monodon]